MRARADEIVTDDAEARLNDIRRRFDTRWLQAVEQFQDVIATVEAQGMAGTQAVAAREAAGAQLVERFDDIITTSHTEAFRLGKGIWGTEPIDGFALDSLEDLIRNQRTFATRFAVDIARGVPSAPGRMSIGARSSLYAQSLVGTYQQGVVGGSPPGKLIWWKLGGCFHCPDCPVLALNSPYTRHTLPASPGDGSTICGSNCCCFLDIRDAPGVQDGELVDADDPLVDRILKPKVTAPPGKRLPTPAERNVLDDLETRMNFARRRIAETAGTPAQARWIKTRTSLNRDIIDYNNARGIHNVPSFSVGDVITGADVRSGAVRNLTHVRGIDGTTIHRADIRAVDRALTEATKDLDDLLKQFPPPTPALPVLEAAGPAPAPSPTAATIVVNVVGMGSAASIENHMAMVRTMSRGDVLRVEIGPFGEDWPELVAVAGSWLSGPEADVLTLLESLGARAAAVRWQESG